jgi:hypothetical protein
VWAFKIFSRLSFTTITGDRFRTSAASEIITKEVYGVYLGKEPSDKILKVNKR